MFEPEQPPRLSTSSLLQYLAPLQRAPSYSAEPHEYEQRIAIGDKGRSLPTGTFIKQSKSGDVRLVLNAQEKDAPLPVYGQNAIVGGTVEIGAKKVQGITSVEIQIHGRLDLREMANSGDHDSKIALAKSSLWTKDADNAVCPSSLSFSLELPATFVLDGHKLPLPPTYAIRLPGMPGFNVSIEYTVSALITKHPNALNNTPIVKSHLRGLHIGETIVSTQFVYYPRTRTAKAPPPPLTLTTPNPVIPPEWFDHTSQIVFKPNKHPNDMSSRIVTTHLYFAASRTFHRSEPIPFHFLAKGSADAIAAYLPYAPTLTPMGHGTRLQLLRQSLAGAGRLLLDGAGPDRWRVRTIGEGTFKRAGEGPTWLCFSGEILVSDEVKVPGFRITGFSVLDFLVLSVTPPNGKKSPFNVLRDAIPVRLTTDPWRADGAGLGVSNVYPAPSQNHASGNGFGCNMEFQVRLVGFTRPHEWFGEKGY